MRLMRSNESISGRLIFQFSIQLIEQWTIAPCPAGDPASCRCTAGDWLRIRHGQVIDACPWCFKQTTWIDVFVLTGRDAEIYRDRLLQVCPACRRVRRDDLLDITELPLEQELVN